MRVSGQDSYGEATSPADPNAKGVDQFQISVTSGTPGTVSYEGNEFDNANAALTIQLNGGSTTSTSLTLAPIASTLLVPGAAPVTFKLVPPADAGWTLSGVDNTVLTGANARDPEIEAKTGRPGWYDVVFFTLSGISTDSGGVFYVNSDANPCVNTQPVVTPTPTPTTTVTAPPPVSNYGDEVNPFGNGFDVYRQHASVNTPIIVWPATQARSRYPLPVRGRGRRRLPHRVRAQWRRHGPVHQQPVPVRAEWPAVPARVQHRPVAAVLQVRAAADLPGQRRGGQPGRQGLAVVHRGLRNRVGRLGPHLHAVRQPACLTARYPLTLAAPPLAQPGSRQARLSPRPGGSPWHGTPPHRCWWWSSPLSAG